DDRDRRHHLRLPPAAPEYVQVRALLHGSLDGLPRSVAPDDRGIQAAGLRGLLCRLHAARGYAPAARRVEFVPVTRADGRHLDGPAAARRCGQRPDHLRRLRPDSRRDLLPAMTLDAKIPSGPLADKWD